MANPTDHWKSFQTWEEDERQTQRVKDVLDTANFALLCSTALSIRAKSEQESTVRKRKGGRISKSLKGTVDTSRFTAGMRNVVVELKFSDGKSWVARIRFPTPEGIHAQRSHNHEIHPRQNQHSHTRSLRLRC
ncbi:hypothetical protein BKA64DRAFT_201969 [Cadophora sp. MPI-SDFR-AT-0126]|nr:hypothetical protein BKA64DRAFT_201969 [Leotiomycetes sp. MPI-SDFR-AT-0126]